MKILITGGSGVIGFNLFTKFKNVYDCILTYNLLNLDIKNSYQLDIKNRGSVLNFIKKTKPDIVIHSAALTNVDLCETDKELAKSINIEGTRNVVDGCIQAGSKIVYISTSSVFDGTKNPYYEVNETKTLNYYSFTKLEGEKIVTKSNLSFLILRTDQPYCWIEKWQKKNSVIRILDNFKIGKPFNEITDWYNTPTYVPNFVDIVSKLIEKNKEGIFHIAGLDFLSRYELAIRIAKIFKKDKNLIIPIQSEELHLPAKRVNVNLNSDKSNQQTGIKTTTVNSGLKKMLKYENTSRQN